MFFCLVNLLTLTRKTQEQASFPYSGSRLVSIIFFYIELKKKKVEKITGHEIVRCWQHFKRGKLHKPFTDNGPSHSA